MREDSMKAFDDFLRSWCKQRGWPYQPEGMLTANDKLRNLESRCAGCKRTPQTCVCDPNDPVHPVACDCDSYDYWADVPGSDEHEIARFDRACEEE